MHSTQNTFLLRLVKGRLGSALPRKASLALALAMLLPLKFVPSAHASGDPSFEQDASGRTQVESQGPLVIFSGVRVYPDGSARLQVKLTASAPVEFSENGKTLRFLLKGTTIHLKNNKHALRAEHFHSNVVRTKLDDTKKGVVYSIQLRQPVIPDYQMVNHAGGAILRIDIPALETK